MPLAAVVASGVAITAWSAGAGPSLPAYVNVAATRAGGAPATSTNRSGTGPTVPSSYRSGTGAPTTPPGSPTASTGTTPPRTSVSPPTTTAAPPPTTATVASTGTGAGKSRTTVITVVVVPRLEGDNGRPQSGDDDHDTDRSGAPGAATHRATAGTSPASQREVGHDN